MKNRILYTTLFLLFFAAGFAQTNVWLQHNPNWIVLRQMSQFYPCIENDTTYYYVNGDTLIDSLTYKKIYARGYVRDTWWSPNPNFSCYANYAYTDALPRYFLRDQGRKMYAIQYGDTIENLLYDFNMTVGSAVPPTSVYWNSGDTITSIDSIFTPYGYRKTYYINNSNWSPAFIEGVGSSYGLFEPFGPMLDQTNTLLCYGMGDTAYWPQMGSKCFVSDVVQPVQPEIAFAVYPNPASTGITITGDVNNGLLEVVDETGNIVLSEGFSLHKEINITAWSRGIYFVRLSSNESTSTTRFIIN